jgi:ribokinase
VYPYLDLLLPNDAEVAELARAIVRENQNPATERDRAGVAATEQAARRMTEAGPAVAVKLGADGALAAFPDGRLVRVPAVPGVRPVDSVGAGDSFDAGFLAATLWGWETERALALGAACGALSTRQAGGTTVTTVKATAIQWLCMLVMWKK